MKGVPMTVELGVPVMLKGVPVTVELGVPVMLKGVPVTPFLFLPLFSLGGSAVCGLHPLLDGVRPPGGL